MEEKKAVVILPPETRTKNLHRPAEVRKEFIESESLQEKSHFAIY
jgi:hypothetical protein